MEIETRRLADLKPADYNPRKKLEPGDPEYEKIARSIFSFGIIAAIMQTFPTKSAWTPSTASLTGNP